jgi:biopolymer transport protein ExbD
MARPVQEVNAGSMADIAFLLLIFFLVTTTIDTDKGIAIKLPPMPEENQPQNDIRIKERNVLKVLVNANDMLLVDGEPTDIKELKRIWLNRLKKPSFPSKTTAVLRTTFTSRSITSSKPPTMN